MDGLDEVAFGAGCTCASALEEGMVEVDMVVLVSLGKIEFMLPNWPSRDA